jgi:DNA-binding transcriptional regulator YhcF (GntR family)
MMTLIFFGIVIEGEKLPSTRAKLASAKIFINIKSARKCQHANERQLFNQSEYTQKLLVRATNELFPFESSSQAAKHERELFTFTPQ